MQECDYGMVMCSHYGCEKEMLRREWRQHVKDCELAEVRCDSCGVKKEAKDDKCDCVTNLKKRLEQLQLKISEMGEQVKEEEKLAEHEEDEQPMVVRQDMLLGGFECLKFEPHLGQQQ